MSKKISNPTSGHSSTHPPSLDGESKDELQSLTNDLKRLQAEFINYKNRAESEKVAVLQVAKAQVVKDLLPIIDDLERALLHQPAELAGNKWAEGVSKVHDRLQKQLEKLGVTKIEALNQPFDPSLHEAVSVDGDGDEQIVSEVLQNGYQIAGQVIRHAVVKVSAS